MVSQLSTPIVLITGASSGIGRAAAHLFAAQGARVVLTARRAPELEALRDELTAAGHTALVVPADLTDATQADALVTQTLGAFGRIDVLVNNAGYGAQCRFDEMEPDAIARMFAVNVLAPMALARAVLPAMRQQGSGSVVNVASVGGVVAHPLNVAYCASKHALVGFSKSLRLELAGTGITVVAVCPGSTRTGFFDRARGEIPFAPMVERYMATPEVVAQYIVQATRSKRAVMFPTWTA